MNWHIPSTGRIYDPGEETVVYFDPGSGNTHLISRFAAYLLELIGQESPSTREIARRATSAMESDDVEALDEAISSALQQLAQLDIIQSD